MIETNARFWPPRPPPAKYYILLNTQFLAGLNKNNEVLKNWIRVAGIEHFQLRDLLATESAREDFPNDRGETLPLHRH
jgi:hypothetical protein